MDSHYSVWANVGLCWQELIEVGIRWRTWCLLKMFKMLKMCIRLEINVGDSCAPFAKPTLTAVQQLSGTLNVRQHTSTATRTFVIVGQSKFGYIKLELALSIRSP